MSICTVDRKTFHQLEVLFIAQWIDQGMDLIAARRLVVDQMANAFACVEDLAIADDLADSKENGIHD